MKMKKNRFLLGIICLIVFTFTFTACEGRDKLENENYDCVTPNCTDESHHHSETHHDEKHQ